MTRFHGLVGYGETIKIRPGVFEDKIVERPYFGDVKRIARKLQVGEKIVGDIKVQNSISVMADAYAIDHFFNIRYVTWSGVRWEVTDVEVNRPRLELRLGGVYNGPTP